MWDDVSSDLVSFSTKRGRQHQLNRIEAGTATILLKNIHGNYWPNNAGGDYYPEVKIGKRINIRVLYDITTYDEYTGFIRKWTPMWFSQVGNKYPGMLLECADLQRNFARAKMNHAGYAEELSGTRIGNVLDTIGWPAGDRDIDAGIENMKSTGAMVNVIAMEHLFSVQESELGTLFIQGDGDVVFHERGVLEALSSQATFGTGNLPIFDVEFPLDDESLYNEIRMTREGGSEQTASSAASILEYGLRTLSRTGLLLITDLLVYVYCLYLLARHNDTKMRIKSFTVKPQTPGDEATLWPLVLGLDIGQKVTLVWSEASINDDYFIEGIEHRFDYREGVWVTKYQCSDATQFYFEPDPMEQTIYLDGSGDLDEVGGDWQDIDDNPDPDDDSTFVYNVEDGPYDDRILGTLESPAYAYGVINKVTIHIRCRATSTASANGYCRTCIKTNGVVYLGSTEFLDDTNWHDFTKEYTTNPQTTDPWTWAEVAALQSGMLIYPPLTAGSPVGTTRGTQAKVVINSTPEW